jgi:transcriptional regulator with XRE-family HTH domain
MTAIASDLVRALRGRRSQAEFSRRLGYRSNIVHRWESGKCWPSAATFFSACCGYKPSLSQCFARLFKRTPEWFDESDPFSPASIAALLRELCGTTPIRTLAERTGHNRYGVGRWLRGVSEPKLPEFLCLIEASSRRLLDFIATLVDPATMVTIASDWKQLQRARGAAYELPWSHAVLRALELEGYRRAAQGERWIAGRLGIDLGEVERSIELLATTGQIKRVRGKWRLGSVISVATGQDATRSRQLKVVWTEVALARLRSGAPGNYGYSVFAVSQKQLKQLRQLHLEYVRGMQSLIATPSSAECVGLYCAQLIDLSSVDNAFASPITPGSR